MSEKKNDKAQEKRPGHRKLHLRLMAILSIVVVTVGTMVLNVAMDIVETNYPISLDLTADGTFTMSESSVKLAQGIAQNDAIGETEIVVFVDEKLFTDNDYTSYPVMHQLKEYAIQSVGTAEGEEIYNRLLESFETVLDQFYFILKQYQTESGGKVTHRFIDVDVEPARAAAYQEYDIEAGVVLFLSADGERSQKFKLLEMISPGEQEGGDLQYNSEVERLVARNLNMVTATNAKKVVFLVGHDEETQLVNDLEQVLFNNACDVKQMDITSSETPDEDTDVFVIPAPTTDYSDEEIARLREWLENGGKRGRDLVVIPNSTMLLTNLYQMVGDEYKIEITDDLICETSSANMFDSTPWYTYGTIAESEHTTLAGQRVLMPMTRALKLNATSSTEASLYVKSLVDFADSAMLQTLKVESKEQEAELREPETRPLSGAAYATVQQYDNDTAQWLYTDVLVFGCSAALYQSNMSLPSAENNEILFTETFRGLTDLDSVISISHRSLKKDYVDFGDSEKQNILTFVFTGGLPGVMIIIGAVVFIRRRRL